MKIYIAIVKYLYDNDVVMTTHLTQKGALLRVIENMREDLTSGIDEDELEEYRSDMPHHYEEDLKQYSSKQLEGIFSDWVEYAHGMIEHMDYDWYETEVQV